MRYLFALLVLVSGCSLENDPSQHMGGFGHVPSNELCTRLAVLQCEQYFECCRMTEPPPGALDACMGEAATLCQMGIGSYLADERTGYDPVAAARILADGEALSAACDVDIARWATTREGLLGVFAGTVPEGGDCTPRTPMDTAVLVMCAGVENSCSVAGFHCVARRPRGELCAIDSDCEAGLACVQDAVARRCAPRLPPGSPCRQGTSCLSYYCDIPMDAMEGTCVAAMPATNIFCGVTP